MRIIKQIHAIIQETIAPTIIPGITVIIRKLSTTTQEINTERGL